MKILQANKFDTEHIIELLENYRVATPIKIYDDPDNVEYVRKILAHVLAGKGICYLAYKDDSEKPIGTIIGIVDESLWDKNLWIMREIAYWVEPEHRGSSAGYRLLKKFIEHGHYLMDNNVIRTFTISKMSNSPNLDYSKFGFVKVEETWSMGE